MASFYAKSPIDKPDQLDVLFVVYPNIVLLDLVGPLQVFTHARKDSLSVSAYQTSVVSHLGGRIGTNTILEIDSDPLDMWLRGPKKTSIHTLVVVGGDGRTPPCSKRMIFSSPILENSLYLYSEFHDNLP